MELKTQMTESNIIQGDNVGAILQSALDAGGGLLRLTPTWVPRSFLHPGKRIKLLAEGDLDRPLAVKVHKISASARRKIEKAGGTVEIIQGA